MRDDTNTYIEIEGSSFTTTVRDGAIEIDSREAVSRVHIEKLESRFLNVHGKIGFGRPQPQSPGRGERYFIPDTLEPGGVHR